MDFTWISHGFRMDFSRFHMEFKWNPLQVALCALLKLPQPPGGIWAESRGSWGPLGGFTWISHGFRMGFSRFHMEFKWSPLYMALWALLKHPQTPGGIWAEFREVLGSLGGVSHGFHMDFFAFYWF